MEIPLPKGARDLKFNDLMLVELNNTNVERMFSPLSQRIVDSGRTSPPLRNLNFEELIEVLSTDESLVGFNSSFGRRLLAGWLRSTQVAMTGLGKSRLVKQINYVRPIHIAPYRSGLPWNTPEHRQADKVVYQAMIVEWDRRGFTEPGKAIKKLAISRLGKGINLEPGNEMIPRYDEVTPIDINQLLSLRFLSCFPPLRPTRQAEQDVSAIDDSVPGSVQPVGQDLFYLLNAYESLQPAEIIEMMLAIIGFRLYQIPFRVQIALSELLAGDHPRDMQDAFGDNPHKIFCDFTGSAGPSQSLARKVVLRDIERMHRLLYDRVLVRSLADSIDTANLRAEYSTLPASGRLRFLVEKMQSPEMGHASGFRIGLIRNHLEMEASDHSEELDYVSEIQNLKISPAEQLAKIIYESIERTNSPNQLKWMWSTGGLLTDREPVPFALLAGSVKHKQTWSYQPTDSLLITLVALCMIEESADLKRAPRYLQQIELGELLARLEKRYGVLINRPPVGFENSKTRDAALLNMEAFKARLKQLGCFDGLSDDAASQPVFNPKVSRHG